MFRTISIAVIGAVLAFLLLHRIFFHPRTIRVEQPGSHWMWKWFKRLVYLATAGSFLILAGTGFYASLIDGQPLHGYFLMIHATFAPVFSVCITLCALLWAQNHVFKRTDIACPCLAKICSIPEAEKHPCGFQLGRKICFWILLLTSIPLIVSMVVSMFPIFGTEGQMALYHINRVSALILLLAANAHTNGLLGPTKKA